MSTQTRYKLFLSPPLSLLYTFKDEKQTNEMQAFYLLATIST